MNITKINMIRNGETARQINLRATQTKPAQANYTGENSRRSATLYLLPATMGAANSRWAKAKAAQWFSKKD
ncbi:MAG TPA: hypothetical protein VGE45_18495 [Chloroflexia bacterium]